MREIKFRAWNCIVRRYKYFTMQDIEKKARIGWDILTIEQFTGLKDKKGKDIYEGDILDYYGLEALIEFRHGCFGYDTYANSKHNEFIPLGRNCNFSWNANKSDELKVIGNIHENPELINNYERRIN